MKYKNCGVIAIKEIFLDYYVFDNYGDAVIPSLTALEDTIVCCYQHVKRVV